MACIELIFKDEMIHLTSKSFTAFFENSILKKSIQYKKIFSVLY